MTTSYADSTSLVNPWDRVGSFDVVSDFFHRMFPLSLTLQFGTFDIPYTNCYTTNMKRYRVVDQTRSTDSSFFLKRNAEVTCNELNAMSKFMGFKVRFYVEKIEKVKK